MLQTPEIIQTPELHYAAIHLTVPREQMRHVMGPGLQELKAAASAQGIAAPSPWFTHHLRMDDDVFDFEICVPTTQPVTPVGRVRPGFWPAMRAARTVYAGGYEDLGEAWGEFLEWIEGQGLPPAADLWERYTVGMEAGADATLYRTELTKPLVS